MLARPTLAEPTDISTDPATLAHEDPAHHAAEIDEDQPRHAAGLETTMEIR
jgi:hypothetical protein